MCKSDFFFEFIAGRIWKVATLSLGGAIIPLPGLSIAVDFTLLTTELNLYKSQLGLPEENSFYFRKMSPEIQEMVQKFSFTSAIQIANAVAAYGACSGVEEVARYIPILGSAVAGTISFSSTYYFLHRSLGELEKTAMDYLDEVNTKVGDDLRID